MSIFGKWRRKISLGIRLNRIRNLILPPVSGVVRTVDNDASVAVPFMYNCSANPQINTPIAIVCHIYYQDLAISMRSLLENIRRPANIFISTDTPEKSDYISKVFEKWPRGRCEVRVVPNRGRDIAPKFVSFADVYKNHELVLFLHTKKSHSAFGDAWRDFLTNVLVGSPEIVDSILRIFALYPDMGIVFPQHFTPVRPWVGWNENFPEAQKFAARMGFRIEPNETIDFPAGSMFWARSSALRPLIDLKLTVDDFPAEKKQVNKTAAHALERLILHVCEFSGYSWLKVAERAAFRDNSSITAIASDVELNQFYTSNRFELMPSPRKDARF